MVTQVVFAMFLATLPSLAQMQAPPSGMRVTSGAAPGYVDDVVCRTCHHEKHDSYQGVGMARSMRRPRAQEMIEDFAHSRFFHAPSQSWYEMEWNGTVLLFRSYQLDENKKRIHVLELKVDWILGSGHRSRVYLYRTPGGELFQLPVAWYTQEKAWGMAPGFDRPDHDGVERRVRRECLFCHNAYPDVPAGSDAHWAPQTFPAALPEGTGCQRCHGPGARHARTALAGGAKDEIRAAIVNPAKLPPDRRDSVCFQCHLLPAVEMIGVRRFDRLDYSFRPGELLSDYMLHVEIEEPSMKPADRFEINHHAYRLQQSLCYKKGGITCINCHDPHQPIDKDPRLASVRGVCLGCHKPHEVVAGAEKPGDCTTCHMPRRRTQDVVHVIMTDHRIQRRPPANALAPLREREPDIADVQFLDPAHVPTGTLGNVYRAVTVLRALPAYREALAHLAQELPKAAAPSKVPSYDLVAAEIQAGRYAEAMKIIASLPADDLRVISWRGAAHFGLGETDAAIDDLRRAVQGAPEVYEYQLTLGVALHKLGRDAAALAPLTHAVELRPTSSAALTVRGEALALLGRKAEAEADRERALAMRPK
ncbi:MAG TPA: cytochrome c3 family protein [Thermoanaerobaculia bacterium]|nr:cytochrome c3 family protein [Thermoanaerobaculia bacterium]